MVDALLQPRACPRCHGLRRSYPPHALACRKSLPASILQTQVADVRGRSRWPGACLTHIAINRGDVEAVQVELRRLDSGPGTMWVGAYRNQIEIRRTDFGECRHIVVPRRYLQTPGGRVVPRDDVGL